jgi:hypothetical protein
MDGRPVPEDTNTGGKVHVRSAIREAGRNKFKNLIEGYTCRVPGGLKMLSPYHPFFER